MTDSTTTASSTTQVLDLDPATLVVTANIRRDLRIDPAFRASIKENGVRIPLVCVRTADGSVKVRDGHRRAEVARGYGMTVPVVIVADEGTTKADEVDRIVTQYVASEHRTNLTTAERVDAVEQLALAGVSAARTAKTLGLAREHVTAALAVAKSPAACEAAQAAPALDLLQLEVVAGFEGDDAAVLALSQASGYQFNHVAGRLREQRASAERDAAYADRLRAHGITVVAQGDLTPLSALVDLTAENHATCPGHAAYVTSEWGYVRADTGEQDEDQHDDDYDQSGDQDDDEDGDQDGGDGDDDGDRPRSVYQEYSTARYGCTDPEGHGHQARSKTTHSGYGEPKVKVADMAPEQAEAARAERRLTIASNKDWKAATDVRVAHLRSLAARKKAPKGAQVFVATALASDYTLLGRHEAQYLAADLFGTVVPGYRQNGGVAQIAAAADDARALVIALVTVLAAYESATTPQTWRNPTVATAAYLRFLAGTTGYALSEVEQRASGQEVGAATA